MTLCNKERAVGIRTSDTKKNPTEVLFCLVCCMFSTKARMLALSSSAKRLDSVLFYFSFLVLAVKTRIAWEGRLQAKFSLLGTKSASSISHTHCDIAIYMKLGFAIYKKLDFEQFWKWNFKGNAY